jgi:hypothetical protein
MGDWQLGQADGREDMRGRARMSARCIRALNLRQDGSRTDSLSGWICQLGTVFLGQPVHGPI